jgi:hypothetical protein
VQRFKQMIDLKFNRQEQSILRPLDSAIAEPAMKDRFDRAALALDARLAEDPHLLLAWQTVPLEAYGIAVREMIRSSWVFILRANVATLPERHPNSHQRMMVHRGQGDFQTWADGAWQSNLLVDDFNAALDRRWVSIPPNVWHRSMKPAQNLVVVSFHTATEEELIEENGDPATSEPIKRRRYAEI